jgi:hypothetical protein
MPPAVPPKDPLSGHVGHLTVEQQHILDKFKKELEAAGYYDPKRHDDATLLRFLRARKFDLEKAKVMFINNEEWRKSFGVEDVVKNFDFKEKAEVDKYYPHFYHKTDKDGRPVYIEQLGKIDMKALNSITSQDRLLKHLVLEYEKFIHERLPACSAQIGHPVETLCTVLDLKNVGISSFYSVKDYIAAAAKIGQDRYPECMGKFYIINAPFMFSTIWTLIKPWLDEVTVAKINILGDDYPQVLRTQVPEENLPAFLGGKCDCPEGCSMSDAGPWNDPELKKVES